MEINPETRVTFIDKMNDIKWPEWKKYKDCSEEEKKKINLANYPNDCMFLDKDLKDKDGNKITDEKTIMEDYEKTKEKLEQKNIKFFLASRSPHGYHILVPFKDFNNLNEELKKEIKRTYIEFLRCDISKVSDRGVVSIPNKPHFKNGKVYGDIEEIKGVNIVNTEILELAKKEMERKKKELSEVNTNRDFEHYFETDKFWELINKLDWKKMPMSCSFNDTISKNLGIASAKSGLPEKEIEKIIKPFIEKIEGYSYGEFKGWYDKKLEEYNPYELNNWVKQYTPDKPTPYDLTPTAVEEFKEEDFGDYYSDEELMNYIPEPQQWLIENQILKGVVGLLVGKRGHRKTFTALYQALCLASGKKVFDKDNVPVKKKVLILDEETGKNEMSQRIKMLKKGMNILTALDIKYLSHSGLKLDINDDKYKLFLKKVEEFKPDLIIVDCLQRFVSFDVDRDNAAISQFFTGSIRSVIKRFGCGWLFIHHLRKPPTYNRTTEDPLDEIRGGTELVNYCRYVLLCKSPRGQIITDEGGEMILFEVIKLSNAPLPEPKVVSFTTTKDVLKVTYEGIPEDVLAGSVKAANAIKDWLFEHQITEFQTKTINEASDEIGFKKNLLNDGLNVLMKKGFLDRPKRGCWEIKGKGGVQKKIT